VVTLDTWTLAWRPHDLDQAYLPFLRGVGTAIPFSDPVFRAGLEKSPEEDLPMAILRWVQLFTGTDKSWEQLAFLREHWDGPIVLKGIQHPDDARKAVEFGMDGVIVSNHGGRQVDGAVAALDALVEVRDALPDAVVLMDGGIRCAADVLKAIALGADAVLLGRPYAYALAVGGQRGVEELVQNLMAEIDLTLALAGAHAVRDLDRSWLTRA